ncbi:alpha/beta hydrolase [Micromonospora chokoriensis]|uniref:Alpha/beta hydrolase family protein n=1 Tax=Micromonospora chokoriensis TaxID=356851 RepID=A0A1C4YK47_9ACTN|nr:alpha/beta hydrolase [Micromonospora chokoriensis]SCF21026.1 Alpha/beta hydrolase family protein [Micromonospora chokoriensis]
MRVSHRRLLSVLAGGALAVGVAVAPAPRAADAATTPTYRPVIFVHGSAGSATQFQSQAKRLSSNGYPIDVIEAHEYDSPNIATILPEVYAGLDARITRLLATTGADRVDLLAHSLGTFVMQGYLNSSPARAARVAHYVNLDGRPAASVPGGVPTLAIWGEGDSARTVVGATNVHLPDQSHTQTVSSPESFGEIFRFLRGRAPHTTRIVPQLFGTARVSGRAVLFPSNAGVTDATVEVYPVSSLTGGRLSHRPTHRLTVGADGSFGPVPVLATARYEFAIVRSGAPTHHFYFQPFLRSDSFVRLATSVPGEGLGALVDTSDRHTALTIQRQKEWWGDQGDAGDHLWINGTDVLNAANAPRAKRTIAIFAFDDGSDGVSDLTTPLPEFFRQTFITGVDLFIPAAPAHLGLVRITVGQRGGGHDVINVPNWRSSAHRVSINIDDF